MLCSTNIKIKSIIHNKIYVIKYSIKFLYNIVPFVFEYVVYVKLVCEEPCTPFLR